MTRTCQESASDSLCTERLKGGRYATQAARWCLLRRHLPDPLRVRPRNYRGTGLEGDGSRRRCNGRVGPGGDTKGGNEVSRECLILVGGWRTSKSQLSGLKGCGR